MKKMTLLAQSVFIVIGAIIPEVLCYRKECLIFIAIYKCVAVVYAKLKWSDLVVA